MLAVGTSGVDAESAQRSGYAPDVIVVLTEGANTQGVEPDTVAETAAVRGVRVHHRVRHHHPDTDGLPRSAAGGWAGGSGGFRGGGGRSPLVIDGESLQAVAETTGGQYYRAESAGQLQEALGDLPRHVTVAQEHIDIASWSAGVSGLLVAIARGLSPWWNRVRTARPAP